MQYRWDDYCLDRHGTLLTRRGQQIDVSRKQLECITHLIEQRHRVVGYDELIRKVWGHDNVSNHQLSQLVLTIRRALGDDGRAQRMIRTLSGLGYRWVAPISEGAAATDAVAQAIERADGAARGEKDRDHDRQPIASQVMHVKDRPDTVESMTTDTETDSSDSPPTLLSTPATAAAAAAAPPQPDRSRLQLWAAVAMALLAFATASWRSQDRPKAIQTAVAASEPATAQQSSTLADPLTAIENRLWRGDMEGVRVGLVALSPELTDSAEARMLEIRMYIEKRRYERAEKVIENELARSKAAADIVWRARLLTLRSMLNSRAGKSAPEVFDPAQEALSLLESVANNAPQSAIGEALSARGTGHMFHGRFESAIQDLMRARDILIKDKEERRVTTTRRMLAHSWLRMGRLSDALEEFNEIAAHSERLHDVVGEVHARDSATRIQIELLRWDEALVNSRRSMKAARQLPDALHRAYTIRLHALVLTNNGYLREAASLIDDTEPNSEPGSVSESMYHLASGNAESALEESAALFAKLDMTSNANLILSSQEGALLLWMTAAQDLTVAGRPMPRPTPEQFRTLEQPQSIVGRIARGRWLWSRGMRKDAEDTLRRAFEESAKKNRLFYMTLAAEPLIGILLEQQDIQAADAVLASLRGSDPDRMDRDYRVSVLHLRTALAKGSDAEIEDMHQRALALAGERELPVRVQHPTALGRGKVDRFAITGSAQQDGQDSIQTK